MTITKRKKFEPTGRIVMTYPGEEETLQESVRPSNSYSLPIVRHLSQGRENEYQSLRDYLHTPAGKKELVHIAESDAKFDAYRIALLDPGIRKKLIEFLKCDGGVDCLVDVGFTEAGMKALIRMSKSDAGHLLSKDLRFRFGILYDCAARIRLKLQEKRKAVIERQEEFPSFDFKSETKSAKLVDLMLDPHKIEAIFFSFSENRQNARLCCESLADEHIRKIVFDYLVANPSETISCFHRLFSSSSRRALMIKIFISEGGVKLLKDLSGSNEGRDIMAKLAITPYGMDLAVSLLSNPWMIPRAIKAGLDYLAE